MIASVKFKLLGKPTVARISNGLRWGCDDKVIEKALNFLYDPRQSGPADGAPGLRQAQQASALLQGTVAVSRQDELPPGVIP